MIVRIRQTSACAACGARGLCHAAESKEKLIEVGYPDGDEQRAEALLGQEVTIVGAATWGLKAVRLAFAYPLLLLVAAMIVAGRVAGANEPVSALAGIGAVALWYLGLSFFKDKLKDQFSFRVEDEMTI